MQLLDVTRETLEFAIRRGNTQRGDVIGFGLWQFELCYPFINSAYPMSVAVAQPFIPVLC